MTISPVVVQISQIIRLSELEQTLVDAWFRPQTLRPGDYWLQEGKVCRHVAFIESGLLRYTLNRDGDEICTFYAIFGPSNSGCRSITWPPTWA